MRKMWKQCTDNRGVARLVKRRCRPAYMCRSRAYLERGNLGIKPHLELLITTLSLKMKGIAGLLLRWDLMDCKLAKPMSFKRINISGLKA